MINGRMAATDGPIKTMTLRGLKDSPPYLHDGRLLTLEDTVEFFNLILETRLSTEEKLDLVAFLRRESSIGTVSGRRMIAWRHASISMRDLVMAGVRA